MFNKIALKPIRCQPHFEIKVTGDVNDGDYAYVMENIPLNDKTEDKIIRLITLMKVLQAYDHSVIDRIHAPNRDEITEKGVLYAITNDEDYNFLCEYVPTEPSAWYYAHTIVDFECVYVDENSQRHDVVID